MWRAVVFIVCLACSACPLFADDGPVEVLCLLQESANPGVIDCAALLGLGGTHTVVSAAKLDHTAVRQPKIDLHNFRCQLYNYLAHHAGRLWHKVRTNVALFQCPHVIERDDHLLIVFSRNKRQTQVLRLSLDDVDRMAAQ